jgi:hypothetical protein
MLNQCLIFSVTMEGWHPFISMKGHEHKNNSHNLKMNFIVIFASLLHCERCQFKCFLYNTTQTRDGDSTGKGILCAGVAVNEIYDVWKARIQINVLKLSPSWIRSENFRKKFVNTAGMCKGQKPGRPWRSVETTDRVRQGYLASPKVNTSSKPRV